MENSNQFNFFKIYKNRNSRTKLVCMIMAISSRVIKSYCIMVISFFQVIFFWKVEKTVEIFGLAFWFAGHLEAKLKDKYRNTSAPRAASFVIKTDSTPMGAEKLTLGCRKSQISKLSQKFTLFSFWDFYGMSKKYFNMAPEFQEFPQIFKSFQKGKNSKYIINNRKVS